MEPAGKLPDGAWPKRVLRLDAEEELLEVVEALERCHRAGERPGGRAVDPADARPQRRLREPLEEAQLEEDTVDPAAREDEGDVASGGLGHEAIVPPWSRSFVPGRWCSRISTSSRTRSCGRVTTTATTAAGTACAPIPFPCPAEGCSFVADFMTAAHLVLVWEERDDPNLLWHAQRAKEVGRNPRVVGYESGFGPSASYYAWEAAGRPVHGVKR